MHLDLYGRPHHCKEELRMDRKGLMRSGASLPNTGMSLPKTLRILRSLNLKLMFLGVLDVYLLR